MSVTWRGEELKRRVRDAQIAAINTTMGACILHAKSGHDAGAHAMQRYVNRTGELSRSMRVVEAAREELHGAVGRWGSSGLAYSRRIELGFQGQDASGRSVQSDAYPYLRPAASVEYPKLADRIVRALARRGVRARA